MTLFCLGQQTGFLCIGGFLCLNTSPFFLARQISPSEGYIDSQIVFFQINRNIDRQTDRWLDIQIVRPIDGQIYRKIDRQMVRYLDRQTDRWLDIQILFDCMSSMKRVYGSQRLESGSFYFKFQILLKYRIYAKLKI